MITWKYTNEPVRAKMSSLFLFIELQLYKVSRTSSKIIFIDKSGSLYHTNRRNVEFILPYFTVPTYRISELMNIEDDDFFE